MASTDDQENKPRPTSTAMSLLRLQSSVTELLSGKLVRASLAEFIGTFVLVLVGVSSCIENGADTDSKLVRISLAFGLTIFAVVWSISHLSGGHINPSVTLAMLVGRRVSLARAIVYIAAQLAGATLAAWVLQVTVMNPGEMPVTVPTQTSTRNITTISALVLEATSTAVLVFTVFAVCDNRRQISPPFGALMIAFIVVACILAFGPFTGASMNSARSFGPAMVAGKLTYHWIYWVGPPIGAVGASLLYDFVFAMDASCSKMKKWLCDDQFDHERLEDCIELNGDP